MKIKLQKPAQKVLVPTALSVALMAMATYTLVTFAGQPKTSSVLIATKDLAEGETPTEADFRKIEIPLGSVAANYLAVYPKGSQLAQSVTKGSLVPKRALARSNQIRVPIRLNNLKPISKEISVGDFVDVWATELSPSVTDSPQPIAFRALVTAIEENTSMTQSSTSVELRVDQSFLESLLAATDSKFQISLILNETLADEK